MSTILSIATAVPAFSATQAEVKAAFRPLFRLEGRRLDAAMALFDNADVATRHSALSLPEIAQTRTLTQTMKIYADTARDLGHRVSRECLRRGRVESTAVDLIITVSCTGVMIPSLDAHLIDGLGMRRDVRRLPITELGCVGGAAAVARAHDYLLGHPKDTVLVVSVELPSLSLQPGDLSADNLVSSAIFGDGAAALLMTGDGERSCARDTPTVRVRETLCHTIPASTYALGFDLHEDGFHAVLSRDVPALLRGAMRPLVEALTTRAGVSAQEFGAYVLHPGGKKILGAVEEALGLRREETQPSWDVLRDYGNQSSASVLFVLERWMTDHRPTHRRFGTSNTAGTLGMMAAFGPGLTAELLLLEWT